MRDDLSRTLGRLIVDPGLLALFEHSPNQALDVLRVDLDADEILQLQTYLAAIRTAEGAQQVEPLLRSADRMVER